MRIFLENYVTADDWGMSPSINLGIIDLAKKGIVRRISLLANGPYFNYELESLLQLKNVEFGLHFNITYARPMSLCSDVKSLQTSGEFYSLMETIQRWCCFRINIQELQRELCCQLNGVEESKIPLTYFDSHHHVHLLPGFFSHLQLILKQRGIGIVRVPYDPKQWGSRTLLNFFSLFLRGELKRTGFSWLPCHYPQYQDFLMRDRLRRNFRKLKNHEIITHPSYNNIFETLKFPDSYRQERYEEYKTLDQLGLEQ